MSTPFTSQNLVNLFGFPFKDPQWKQKVLLGALLLLASPFTAFISSVFTIGYAYRIMRQMIKGEGDPVLPNWDNWESLFIDGIRLVGVSLIFTAPGLILYGLGAVLSFSMPFLASVLSDPAGQSSLFTLFTFGTMGLTWIIFGAAIIVTLALGLILPAPLCHVVANNRFGAAFHFSEWWPIFKANFGGFILSYLLVLGSSMIFSIAYQVLYLTIILCCTLPIVLSVFGFYIPLVSYTLYSQAYRNGVEALKSRESLPGAPVQGQPA